MINKVASRYIQSGRLSLTDPAFNLREFAKQLVLLEDHLAQPNKYCPDCIRKHLLMAEAYAEEAVALDATGVWGKTPAILAERVRLWAEAFLDGVPPKELAQRIRATRKEISPYIFNPRTRN
jgi:hypothetical protein